MKTDDYDLQAHSGVMIGIEAILFGMLALCCARAEVPREGTGPEDSSATAESFASPKFNRDEPARRRFSKAESFYTYYGRGKTAELSRFDIVIAHSSQMRSSDVKKLTEMGVVAIG
jgi:hypothetical protein